ncbi:recombinase family protein [Bremerella sp.]|uniref:recombinase family protein n=1 Tax=Bremerella sp. TaxID=2795602 RepID=UPI0039197311
MMASKNKKPNGPKPFRCAIYTRKSTEEGLQQEYNTLDAQRDAGESYIKSQQHEGWTCLPEKYDDGGFTGANMDRPALRRLVSDIEAGQIDCVVVYKVDRLSRSLLDFAKIMETFDRHGVAFVSVTQAFNTGSSMGRLVLNVLLSFAQFEREMISERTRDKIAAARRKGKWAGGMPVLGYNVENTKLVVNEDEAKRVREIFDLYLKHQSALAVAKILNERGWRTKRWVTARGTVRGGRDFNKNSVHKLLTSPVYLGKICYKSEVHDGEHEAIIDPSIFAKVQTILKRNAVSGGRAVRNKHNALLRGLICCATCDCGMSHSFARKGSRMYRYYVCQKAQKQGWEKCPAPSLPAAEVERFVVDQIKGVGRDTAVVRETLAQVRRQRDDAIERLSDEQDALKRQIVEDTADLGRLAAIAGEDNPRLVETQDRIQHAERRLTEIKDELVQLAGGAIDETEIKSTLRNFDQLWDCLHPKEQSRIIELLVEQVTYDGDAGKLSITYQPTGFRTLTTEFADRAEEAA